MTQQRTTQARRGALDFRGEISKNRCARTIVGTTTRKNRKGPAESAETAQQSEGSYQKGEGKMGNERWYCYGAYNSRKERRKVGIVQGITNHLDRPR